MSVAAPAAARDAGTVPPADYMAGHSLGEYSALTAAGAMDIPTALRLVRKRGLLMKEALAELIEHTGIHDPSVPVAANSTAKMMTSVEDVREIAVTITAVVRKVCFTRRKFPAP